MEGKLKISFIAASIAAFAAEIARIALKSAPLAVVSSILLTIACIILVYSKFHYPKSRSREKVHWTEKISKSILLCIVIIAGIKLIAFLAVTQLITALLVVAAAAVAFFIRNKFLPAIHDKK